MHLNKFFTQIFKFFTAGGITTIFGLTSYYICLESFSLPLYPVYIIVYLLGVALSYLLNSKYTFNRAYNKKTYASYFITYTIGLLSGLLLITLLKLYFPELSDFITTVLVIPPRFILTFILLKLKTFKD